VIAGNELVPAKCEAKGVLWFIVLEIFDIVVQFFISLKFFDLELIFSIVCRLVGFIKLIKSCSKDWVTLSIALTINFNKANQEALPNCAVSES
jgi:hypothetical protein